MWENGSATYDALEGYATPSDSVHRTILVTVTTYLIFMWPMARFTRDSS